LRLAFDPGLMDDARTAFAMVLAGACASLGRAAASAGAAIYFVDGAAVRWKRVRTR
jgi:hypothetical protein